MWFDVAADSHALDPGTTIEFVRRTMAEDNDTNWEEWKEEASLEDHEGLRWLSLASPFFVVATFAVCFYHIGLHTGVMHSGSNTRGQRSALFRLHDKTIRILLLPAVYSLMSLHGVVYMLGIVLNVKESEHFTSWKQRSHYYTEMYRSAFYVGDIYESFALLVLGNLIMNVLQTKVESAIGGGNAAHKDTIQRSTSISSAELMREMKELTTFGIKFFCWTCGLQASYQLGCAVMGYYHLCDSLFGLGDENGAGKGLIQQKSTTDRAECFFLGAGFVASFAAIGNIMKVESAFHVHLSEFHPFWKFWGTKMLVSIAFLQSMALVVIPPFCWWSKTRVNLFYAALLCFECFIVSIVHLQAWGHDQRWYLGATSFLPSDDEETGCDEARTSTETDSEVDDGIDNQEDSYDSDSIDNHVQLPKVSMPFSAPLVNAKMNSS